MNEVKCNLHIHSKYSDGTSNYTQIAEQAILANLDVVIITDHNVKVNGVDRYYSRDGKKVLLLTGEEVHNQDRMPQKNHALVIGCDEEVSHLTSNPQSLIDHVRAKDGVIFLAHPYEFDLPLFNETDITWENWEVRNFTGLELWNGFSEFKTVVKTFPQALYYAFFPERIPHGPLPQALLKWDELLKNDQMVFAVAGSDSHALNYHKGLLRKTIFPYRYHFSTINNHILLPELLCGDVESDKRLIYRALKNGSLFIGNDLPLSTSGFSFTADIDDRLAGMGEELMIRHGATLRVNLPQPAEIRLIHDGKIVQSQMNTDRLVFTATEPGFYRAEAYLLYFGKSRGWIFSNPIFLKKHGRK